MNGICRPNAQIKDLYTGILSSTQVTATHSVDHEILAPYTYVGIRDLNNMVVCTYMHKAPVKITNVTFRMCRRHVGIAAASYGEDMKSMPHE